MNVFYLLGRLTADPVIAVKSDTMETARYTLAVDRRQKKTDGQNADFISCVAFGKTAEFADKWLKKGTKILVSGHIQSGSYIGKDGKKVYSTDLVIDSQEFVESRSAAQNYANANQGTNYQGQNGNASKGDSEGFVSISDADLDELPFK